MSQFRDVEQVLNAWRAAARKAAGLLPGSPEHVAAEADAERLRHDYQSLVDGPGAMAAPPESDHGTTNPTETPAQSPPRP